MSGTVTITINDGTLRGRKETSKNGKTYYSFKGVPFAKPPVGALRFKVAQPVEPWSGVRDALEEGNSCTQFNFNTKQYEGSEDCLHLNVYSPLLPASGSKDALKPVMFYIHGGGFVFGSNSSQLYGPDYLVDEDVVLVVSNYRLGIFGFLCLDDPIAPGNIGLKDQVAALRWVQKNITKFGGDPNNVTIFGESAGGASVHFQLLSPMSKGLFKKAILMSGVAINPWCMTNDARQQVNRVAEALGFTGKKPKDIVEFLRNVDHIELVKAAVEHSLSEEDKQRIMIFPFVPTLEVAAEGVERFLPASPLELMEEGHYHAVPCIAGLTNDEGILTYISQQWVPLTMETNIPTSETDFANDETFKRIERDFEKIVQTELRLPKNYKKTKQVASKIWTFFMKDKPFTKETLPAFIDMYTDLHFAEGMHVIIKKMAQLTKAPLYFYYFNFDGKLNLFKALNNINAPGASHADDLGYLFRISLLDLNSPANSRESVARSRMTKLWTNFAKTGDPTPKTDDLLPVKWTQYTTSNSLYLDIGEKLGVKEKLNEERMKFWEELYCNL